MKKLLFVIVAAMLILAGCAQGNKAANNEAAGNKAAGSENAEQTEAVTLKVGASPVPHAEILKFVAPVLEEQGVLLEVVEFTDYVQPNVQLYDGALDANFFQHLPYLEQFNADKGYDLVSVAGIHIEPFGLYSNKIESLEELNDLEKVSIAIPNDPTNGGRALLLLEQNGVIELDDEAGLEATEADVVNKPDHFEFAPMEAAMIARMLEQFDIAAINTNYALEAGLNPRDDAIVLEDAESPYVNIIATRPDNQDSEAIQKLIAALQTEEVEQFINEKYEGAVVPTFQ